MIALFITPQFYVWYTLAYNFHMPLCCCVFFLSHRWGNIGARLESWPSGAPSHAVGLLLCNNASVTRPRWIYLYMNSQTIASNKYTKCTAADGSRAGVKLMPYICGLFAYWAERDMEPASMFVFVQGQTDTNILVYGLLPKKWAKPDINLTNLLMLKSGFKFCRVNFFPAKTFLWCKLVQNSTRVWEMKTANLCGSNQILPVSIKLNIFSAPADFTCKFARAQKLAVQKHISSLKVDLSCGASPRRSQKHKYCKFRNDRCIIHVSIFRTLPRPHIPWNCGGGCARFHWKTIERETCVLSILPPSTRSLRSRRRRRHILLMMMTYEPARSQSLFLLIPWMQIFSACAESSSQAFNFL